jgi:hypothetical protein
MRAITTADVAFARPAGDRVMAKKMIRPIRAETEYDEALDEIELLRQRTKAGHGGGGSVRSARADHRGLRAQALADRSARGD